MSESASAAHTSVHAVLISAPPPVSMLIEAHETFRSRMLCPGKPSTQQLRSWKIKTRTRSKTQMVESTCTLTNQSLRQISGLV